MHQGINIGTRPEWRAAARIGADPHQVILVEDEHPTEDLLGLYEGISLTDRYEYSGALPDVITIYRRPILAMVASREEALRQIAITVVHEIGHHFGIDDSRLHELGYG